MKVVVNRSTTIQSYITRGYHQQRKEGERKGRNEVPLLQRTDSVDNCINIQHDFYRFRDTRVILREDDIKRLDLLPFSAYKVGIDISELYPAGIW